MATWGKYQKKSTIVGATQADTGADYGTLGTLISTDWVITLASGQLVTMDNTTFTAKYSAASDTSALTGTDWD